MLFVFIATRVHCWLMFHLMFTRTPTSFSAEMFSSRSVPHLNHCRWLVHPGCWTLYLSSLNFMSFLWPIPPACQVPSEWQLCPEVYQPFPQFSLIYNVMGECSSSSCSALVTIISWIGLVALCGTSLGISL